MAAVAWSDHLDQLDFFVKRPVLLGRAVLPAMRQGAGFLTGQRLVVDGGRGLVG